MPEIDTRRRKPLADGGGGGGGSGTDRAERVKELMANASDLIAAARKKAVELRETAEVINPCQC